MRAVEARQQVMATGTRDNTLLEVEKSKVKPPPLFKVLLLNDDYTPMDFVVSVLQTFFSMTREQATQIMLKVHREGMGVCGVYPKDVAATKVEQVIAFSRQHQHPLQCVMEEHDCAEFWKSVWHMAFMEARHKRHEFHHRGAPAARHAGQPRPPLRRSCAACAANVEECENS